MREGERLVTALGDGIFANICSVLFLKRNKDSDSNIVSPTTHSFGGRGSTWA
jgi:hypothetical protein